MEVLCRRSLSGLKEASAGSGRGSKRLRESDDVTTGASEHVAKNFVRWLKELILSIKRHKEDPQTVIARGRSGDTHHKSGLTDAQMRDRKARNRARNNFSWAKHLDCLLYTSPSPRD